MIPNAEVFGGNVGQREHEGGSVFPNQVSDGELRSLALKDYVLAEVLAVKSVPEPIPGNYVSIH